MPVSVAVPRPSPQAIGVSELVARIRVALQENFPGRLWVEGELSNFRVARTGHAFGVLKDEQAQVELVIWKDRLAVLKFVPADGMQVLARIAKVDFWGPSGRLRVQIESLEPQGTGALQKAYEERKARFLAEGLFDQARKRPLPRLPRAVGIATAPTGAVIHDMLRVLGERFAERRVLLRPCRVQGEGAAADVAAAIDDLNRDGSVDVIIVGRGGGSIEDLWAFNEEVVVRAVAGSRIPIVSAVGHEVDWTLADLAADVRALTPTAAAQMVMPERAAIEAELAGWSRRSREAIERRLEFARTRLDARRARLGDPRGALREGRRRLDRLAERARDALRARTPGLRERLARARGSLRSGVPGLALGRVEARRLGGRLGPPAAAALAAHERDLARLGHRLTSTVGGPLAEARERLSNGVARLDALSPLSVLARGYALAFRADGTLARDAGALVVGEELDLHLARGRLRTRVLEALAKDGGPVSEPPSDGSKGGRT